MSKLNLTFRFATSRQNVSDKFPMVESFIKQFINEWFSGSLISEEIQVVLTDSIKKTNEERLCKPFSVGLVRRPNWIIKEL